MTAGRTAFGSCGGTAMGRIRQAAVWASAVLLLAAARGPAAGDDGLRQKALRLNDITGKDAISGKILELVKDKSELKKLISEASKIAKEKEQPFNYNGAYILAKASQVAKDYDASLAFYKICQDQALKLHSGQKMVDVYDGLIAVYFDTKKFDEAEKVCDEFVKLKGGDTVEKVKPFVLEQMVRAMARQGKFDKALELNDKLINLDEGGWYFLMLKADVLREAGKFDEAIGTFEDTMERLGKSKLEDEAKERYVDRCRYVMSSVYTDMGKTDKAIDELRKLLKAHPDSSTYNNDLGYLMADHDQNLDESEKLVKKALDLDKAERAKLKEKGLLDD